MLCKATFSYSKNLNIVFKIMMYNKRKMSMTYCRVAMWIQLKWSPSIHYFWIWWIANLTQAPKRQKYVLYFGLMSLGLESNVLEYTNIWNWVLGQMSVCSRLKIFNFIPYFAGPLWSSPYFLFVIGLLWVMAAITHLSTQYSV